MKATLKNIHPNIVSTAQYSIPTNRKGLFTIVNVYLFIQSILGGFNAWILIILMSVALLYNYCFISPCNKFQRQHFPSQSWYTRVHYRHLGGLFSAAL